MLVNEGHGMNWIMNSFIEPRLLSAIVRYVHQCLPNFTSSMYLTDDDQTQPLTMQTV